MTLDLAIAELRKRNEPVPIPSRLPSLSEVDAAEQSIGVPFPSSFRQYLLEASDIVYGTLEPVTITLPDSHTDLTEVFVGAKVMGVPENHIPICEDNGDYYLMRSDGSIMFWSHDGTTDLSWPDLAAWIESVWLNEK